MDYKIVNEETVIAKARVHWSVCLLPVAVIGVASWKEWGVLVAAGGIWLVWVIINALSVKLEVSSKRLHGKYGIINTKQMDVLLNKVGGVNVRKGLLGRILGYGNLEVRTEAGVFVFKRICAPETFRNTVIQAQDQLEEGRFERQSSRFEGAIQQQTMLQMKAAEQIAVAAACGLPEKRAPQAQLPGEREQEVAERLSQPSRMRDGVVRKKTAHPMWKKGCPLLVSVCAIEEITGSHGMQVSITVQNLEKTAVEALYLDIQGFDVLKEEKCFLKKIPILDLDIIPGGMHTLPPVELPDPSIRRVQLYIRYVVFADEQVWNDAGEEPFQELLVQQTPYESKYRPDLKWLAEEAGLLKGGACRYTHQPVYQKDYWICGCQQFNTGDACISCGALRTEIQKILRPEIIEARYQERTAMEEKERQRMLEEEERRRAEEERIWREQEEEKRRIKEQREEQMRQVVQQVQSRAGKLMGAVKSGADSLKEGTAKQAGSLKRSVSHQVDGLLSEARKENEKKNCSKCGAVQSGNARFCTKCGQPLDAAEPSETKEQEENT